jgi:xanthine dehydrogenase accessory factor
MSAPHLESARATAGQWLRPLGDNWSHVLCRLLEAEPAVVRVVIAAVRGSAPREPGACMLVSAAGSVGTIGGGRLEWQAAQAAQKLLRTDSNSGSVRLQHLTLGPDVGQCCGGIVQLWLERFTRADDSLLRAAVQARSEGMSPYIATELAGTAVRRRLLLPGSVELHEIEAKTRGSHSKATAAAVPPRLRFLTVGHDATLLERLELEAAQLWLFGAGHVGQALVRVLADLPFDITWIDERADLLPGDLPSNVRAVHVNSPLETITSAAPGARYLVMTHDHALDYALCHAVLERNDFAWLGLIGSKSKGARFRSRLARDRVSAASIARLVCPIGVEGVNSKSPAAIAVGVAAQLLQGSGSTPSVADESDYNTTTEPVPGAAAAMKVTKAVAGHCPSRECLTCSPPPGRRT